MSTYFARPNLTQLNPLRRILPADWHKFGINYKSMQTDSSGFPIGGQLVDGRRFTWSETKKQFQFTK